MQEPRLIALAAFTGCQLLDLTGPASVFAAANEAAGEHAYTVQIVSSAGGLAVTSAGVGIDTCSLAEAGGHCIDTLLTAGGEEAPLRAAAGDVRLMEWLIRQAPAVRRLGSVCSGTFLLAAAGLLEGRRVATHWAACNRLAHMFPGLTVDAEALFVTDGKVWTSAGVSTGIDMALAMVEQDLSPAIASQVAQRLVLYLRRPGHQSQFSPLLKAQAQASAPFVGLIDWMRGHLGGKLDVPALAARAGLSERTFYRRFSAEAGMSPALFVESLRIDAARALLDRGESVKAAAKLAGFRSTAHMSVAFERRLGMRPSLLRRLHKGARDAAGPGD
jgi:transcriptional regulator GlxA family with amidase domain